MSEFEGGKVRVRCVDCTRLVGSQCGVKHSKVGVKKRRVCSKYDFKGEFENRTSPEAAYLPHVDPKTRRLMKKLMKLGVLGDKSKSPLPAPVTTAAPYVEDTASFKSTATAQLPVVAPLQSVGEAVQEGSEEDSNVGQ